jgi:hypothetical protein
MKIFLSILLFLLIVSCSKRQAEVDTLLKADENASADPRELVIHQSWSGDYPVAELQRLPEGQQETAIGYLGNAQIFSTVWKVFLPEEEIPEIDFSKRMVVFVRNITYFNRTNIMTVKLAGGVVEVLAMETMSALPIEEKAAMAMAVIDRAGMRAIKAGETEIEVKSQ